MKLHCGDFTNGALDGYIGETELFDEYYVVRIDGDESMKKNQVHAILTNQTKRRNKVFALVCIIVIMAILSFSFFLLYYDKNQIEYVEYKKDSAVDYEVFLKDTNIREEDFFDENYVETDKKFIARLIDSISAEFRYRLSIEERDVEYKYAYRIESVVEVKERNADVSFYHKSEQIVDLKEATTTEQQVVVSEQVQIDYHKYNDMIQKFVSTYELENVESTLTVSMHISVTGSCEAFANQNTQESVLSLRIPLATKTVALDVETESARNNSYMIQCKNTCPYKMLFLCLGWLCVFVDVALVAYTIRYEIKTRTAENIYEKELKKILNNYSSYIQTIGTDIDFSTYQKIRINTFSDMLEIRDTIRQPILLRENKEKTGAYFVIPSNTKVLYVYCMKVSDIAREIQKKS